MKQVAYPLIVLFFLLSYSGYSFCEATDAGFLDDALSKEASVGNTPSDIKLPGIFDIMVRFLFAILILMVLIFVSALVYKYFLNMQISGNNTKIIKLLEHRYIDPKKSLYLVEVAGKYFLMSSSGENFRLVSEISGEDSVAYIKNVLDLRSEMYGSKEFKNVIAGVENINRPQDNVAKGYTFVKNKIEQIRSLMNKKSL